MSWYACAVDVERTIEFILKSQARAEIRMEKMDKRINGISKILQQGMRMLAKTQTTLAEVAEAQKRTDMKLAELAEAQKRTDVKLTELAEAHKDTERTLKAFINSLRHGQNGRSGR